MKKLALISLFCATQILAATRLPEITVQPQDVTAAPKTTAKFTVEATGSGKLNYTWFRYPKSGMWSVVGSNRPIYEHRVLPEGDNGSRYNVIVWNKNWDFDSSNVVTLTVSSATPSPTWTPTPTPSATSTPSPTVTPIPSPSPTSTVTPTPSPTATPTPSSTPSPSATPSPTSTPIVTKMRTYGSGVLMKGGEHLTESNPNLTNPQIYYYRLRFSAAEFQPKEDSVLDFSSVVKDAAIAAKHGQGIAISFGWGGDTAAWLKTKCALLTDEEGDTFPKPWDKEFIKHRDAFVKEAGRQLDAIPNLIYVCVTSLSGKNNELRLNVVAPISAADIVAYLAAGKSAIDLYGASFPLSVFMLTGSGSAYPGDKNMTEILADYGCPKYPHRFGIGEAGFSASHTGGYLPDKMIIKYAGKNPSFLQQVSGSDQEIYHGTWEQSIANLALIPANCLEIYKSDLPKVNQAVNDALNSNY